MGLSQVRRGIRLGNKFLRHIRTLSYIRQPIMHNGGYNLLFRWFTGLGIDDPVWDVTVFTKNRNRLLDGDIVGKFFAAVLNHARINGPLSDEHFSVDGTLI